MKRIANGPDFDLVTRELVALLRGRLSQERLSRALGYTHNQLYKWEKIRKRISWDEFARLCELRKKPLLAVVTNCLGDTVRTSDGRRIFNELVPPSSHRAFQRLLGVPLSSVTRWAGGKQALPAYVVLAALHLTRNYLMRFCERLNPERFPASLERFKRTADTLYLISREHPWAQLLPGLLGMSGFPNASLELAADRAAEMLPLSRSEALGAFCALRDHGFLEYQGGVWGPRSEVTQIADSLPTARLLNAFWFRQAERFATSAYPSPPSLLAHCTVALSPENAAELRKRIQRFWSEIGPLLIADQERSELFALALAFLNVKHYSAD